VGGGARGAGKMCSLHDQEKLNIKAQFDTFLHELKRTKKKLASLNQTKKRIRRILVKEAASKQQQGN
jgi:phosphopantothenoylcysteine synthetase/decarboxylase